jgi:hypothetical protein
LKNVVYNLAHYSFIAIFLLTAPIAFAQSAGTILFKSGNAVVTRADQSTHPIQQHDAVLNGDTIDTKNGRVQIGFVDGGKVSLQPETIYKINQYSFSGEEDGSEYALTELIKGGLRTISGLIGHKNRERYQLSTPVATIGIRGTEFTVIYIANKLIMTTNQGSVDVCNAGGCRNAVAGQSITTSSKNSRPQPTNDTANVTAAPPSVNKPIFVQSENLGEDRINNVVTESVMQASLSNLSGAGNNAPGTPTDPSAPITSAQTDILLSGIEQGTSFNYALIDGTLDSNANNNLSRYQTQDIDLQLIAANLDDFYSDAFVSMGLVRGRINNQNVGLLSYVAGDATQPANLLQLANLNTALQYNVLASTSPVLGNQGQTIAIGTPNNVTGNLSVNFANYAYSYGLNIPFGLITYRLAGNSTLTAGSAEFANNGSITSNLGNIGCIAGCSGAMQDANGNTASIVGRFIGPAAERAGIQYGFNIGRTNTLTGSIVLGR